MKLRDTLIIAGAIMATGILIIVFLRPDRANSGDAVARADEQESSLVVRASSNKPVPLADPRRDFIGRWALTDGPLLSECLEFRSNGKYLTDGLMFKVTDGQWSIASTTRDTLILNVSWTADGFTGPRRLDSSMIMRFQDRDNMECQWKQGASWSDAKAYRRMKG